MFKIGIIGAENSHAMQIGKIINIRKMIPGVRVVAIWGETMMAARQRSKEVAIETVVREPRDMLGKVDAVMVDHRHGKFHLPAAWPFLKARIPMFIDKPFCYRLAEGKRFLREANTRKATVISLSAMKVTDDFRAFKRDVRKLGKPIVAASWGPANIKAQRKWGGAFFYGCHQIEMLLDAFGFDVRDVTAVRNGVNAMAILRFRTGLLATAHFMGEPPHSFDLYARCEKGTLSRECKSNEDPYLAPTRLWVKACRTGKTPYGYKDFLAPIAVLEAFEKSLKTGKAVRVSKIDL